jgi:hypothetical protein
MVFSNRKSHYDARMCQLKDPTCGDCKAFYMEAKDENGAVRGLCRLREELGEIPANMDYCHLFRVREARAGQVKAVDLRLKTPKRTPKRSDWGDAGDTPPRPTLNTPVEGETEGEIVVDRNGLKQVLRELLEEETMYGYPEMGRRWQGGKLLIEPGDAETQSREVPLDTFFHKIVMVRDRLRVLEAKINGNDKLEETDKVELQGYISKCYGTLTTFNALFRDKSDHFRSK